MNIGVIGGGATGLLLSSYLQQNHELTVYVRRLEQQRLLMKKRLQLLVEHRFEKEIAIQAELLSNIKQHDAVFVCVKQYALQSVLNYLNELSNETYVIFLQNGMGHVPFLDSINKRIIVGVIEHGVSRLNDCTIDHLGRGQIKLAPYTTTEHELKQFVERINLSDFPFSIEQNWRRLLQDKLIVNAVINPLTALFNVENGAIIHNPPIKRLAKRVLNEAAKALEMDEKAAWEKVERTANVTKHNTSSMRADILAKRKTEIEAITGYILTLLSEEEAPHNTFLYEAIKALEAKENIKDD